MKQDIPNEKYLILNVGDGPLLFFVASL